ncbi:phage tail assembly chaperone [Paracoccus sp. 1_MG-2023]|uniref:rcc01693 family protein n=1 Tax=unclassified Paracoccus (in: a-proteobacteria) TaxID=2688777 RepID=UPI001C090B30|nr:MULTISPECIES: rcc01693 family protein [unclassified Paracoccus (in: a-proteobacteria)]MBU2958635.1 phage tail assembly chaperone [Paracoccus sp. C2R09]MDO6667628.1 phage tail assembly chaperone [Paracoccus sp. 1_MG-2023]
MSLPGAMDWPGMMRAGLVGLRLHPDQFWSLTPAELALMLGLGPSVPRMSRNRLAELAARYPDAEDCRVGTETPLQESHHE